MDERLTKLRKVFDEVMAFVGQLPQGYQRDHAYFKAQESIWWCEKAVSDDLLAKKEPKSANP